MHTSIQGGNYSHKSLLYLSSTYTVITVGLVPDPTAGTPNYPIPENTSPFQFCAQITAGTLARTAIVNLVTQQGLAQGLCNTQECTFICITDWLLLTIVDEMQLTSKCNCLCSFKNLEIQLVADKVSTHSDTLDDFLPSDPDDYVGGSFPLVFTSTTGNTPVCVPVGNVVIVNDAICEDDETFFVQLSTPAGETQVILNPQTGTATIIDDDGNFHSVCSYT